MCVGAAGEVTPGLEFIKLINRLNSIFVRSILLPSTLNYGHPIDEVAIEQP